MKFDLRRILKHKEIGWDAIKEEFTRFAILKTPYFNVYLHRLYAPIWSPDCHDHPWSFVTILLRRGYLEQIGDKKYRRRAGSILYRPATFAHNVTTPYGVSWSLIITGPKTREWKFLKCE